MSCFKNPRRHPMITPQGFWQAQTHTLISPPCFVHNSLYTNGAGLMITEVSHPMCSKSVLRLKRKIRLWEKQVCMLTLSSLKSPSVGWNLRKTPFGMSGRRQGKVLEGAARGMLRVGAGLAEQSCPAQPVLHCLFVLLGPGADSATAEKKGEQLCSGIWVRRNTRDWCNSIMCFGCPTAAQGPPETPTQRQRGAWGEAHLSWLSEGTFLSCGWHSQRQRQTRLFKMYF